MTVLDEAKYPFKQIAATITVSSSTPGTFKPFSERRYGAVWRNGKAHYRNYGHELKNGKGMTILEVNRHYMNAVLFQPVFRPIIHSIETEQGSVIPAPFTECPSVNDATFTECPSGSETPPGEGVPPPPRNTSRGPEETRILNLGRGGHGR